MLQLSPRLKTDLSGTAVSQSISQLLSQRVSQSNDQSIERSINQSVNQSINQSVNRPVSQSIDRRVKQPTNLSTNISSNQSTNQPINQSTPARRTYLGMDFVRQNWKWADQSSSSFRLTKLLQRRVLVLSSRKPHSESCTLIHLHACIQSGVCKLHREYLATSSGA